MQKTLNFDRGLVLWCKKNKISTSTFAKETGFSYMYSWRLLSGKSCVKEETLGRFLLTFGLSATQELFEFSTNTTSLDDKKQDGKPNNN